jgi:hypothetical protein
MIARILLGMLIGASLCMGQTTTESGRAAQGAPALKGVLPSFLTGASRDIKSSTNVFLAFDGGEVYKGVYSQPVGATPAYRTLYDHLWQQHLFMYLSENISFKERLRFILSVECDLDFSFQRSAKYPASLMPRFNFYPNDMEVQYRFGDLNNPWLQIALGYFPFKYNPDAKNLGEFLVRSYAYPTIILSSFEFAMTRELGLHLNGFFGNPEIYQLSWDLLLTSETHDFPQQDGTLTAVVSNNLLNFFDLGLGVSFQRLFPVDEKNTTLKNSEEPLVKYFSAQGDTNYYGFQSSKLMGRASINPQRFIPRFTIPPSFIFGKSPFFGKDDLKIYAEAAVLGIQDFVAYDSIPDSNGVNHWQLRPDSLNYYKDEKLFGIFPKDRTPLMVGVNLPTQPLISYGILPFILTKWLKDETGADVTQLAWVSLVPALASGVLDHFLGWDLGPDVLSLEFEWFSQRFPNSNYNVVNPQQRNMPIPVSNGVRLSANIDPVPVKYSLYFKKTFMDRFALSGLVGRDHMRPTAFAISPTQAQCDDFLQSKSNWWWTLRLSANF